MSLPHDAQRGTLIALEPRIRAAFHPLHHAICERTDLTPGAKIVYAVLVSYHQRFRDVFPGRDRLAHDTGISKRQLVEHIKTLTDRGLLLVERRGLGMTNVYTLLRWPDEGSAETAPAPADSRTTAGAALAPPQLEEEAGEQEADAIWKELVAAATLPTGIRGLLAELPVRLDGGAIVVRCPANLRQHLGYLRQAAGARAVRVEG